MAYYLSVSNPHPSSIGTPLLDDPPGSPFHYVKFADPENVHWRAKLSNTVKMKQGYPVKPKTVPRRILWDSLEYSLPDVVHNQQVFCVCERFRDLVEQFEPGMHQFIPAAVYQSGNRVAIAEYYWFVVCQRLYTVNAEHTTYDWMLDYTKEDGFWTNNMPSAKLVLSSEKIASHHIWVDPHLIVFNSGLCSNAFGEAALAADFSGLNVTHREEM